MECAIKKIDGVQNANVNFLMQKMTLELDETNEKEIIAEIKKVCKRIEPDCIIKA